MENGWMANNMDLSSSLLNPYSSLDEVFGGQDWNFVGNNEEAACTLPPPCTGDLVFEEYSRVRVDEPFEDTKLVADLYNDNGNNNNVAAPPEMDTDSDVEWLESMLEAPETPCAGDLVFEEHSQVRVDEPFEDNENDNNDDNGYNNDVDKSVAPPAEHGCVGDAEKDGVLTSSDLIRGMFNKFWEYDPWADMKELKELYYAKLMPLPPYGDINDVAMEEKFVSDNNNNAENGDQENNNGVLGAVFEEENVSTKHLTELVGHFVNTILKKRVEKVSAAAAGRTQACSASYHVYGDQERSNNSSSVFDGASNALEISWDEFVRGDNDPRNLTAPQEYMINEEEQYKQLVIIDDNHNNNNVGEEENASMAQPDYDYEDKTNNDDDSVVYMEVDSLPPAEDTITANQLMVDELYQELFEEKDIITSTTNNNNTHAAPKEYYINDDMFMAAAPQQPTLFNFPAAGNAMHVSTAAATTSSTRAPRIVWTEEEQKQFLIGLGVGHINRGKWKLISAQFVPTKSPTQIASHAQKYFNRLDSIRLAAAASAADANNNNRKRKRRRSIHDITL